MSGLIAAGRAAAEKRMRDEVEIRGPDTLGPMVDGRKPIIPGPLRYRGRAKVQSYEAFSGQAQSGGHMYVTLQHRVDIPVDAGPGPFVVRDVVKVLASEDNPSIVGLSTVIVGVPVKSQTTAKRLQCQQIAG